MLSSDGKETRQADGGRRTTHHRAGGGGLGVTVCGRAFRGRAGPGSIIRAPGSGRWVQAPRRTLVVWGRRQCGSIASSKESALTHTTHSPGRRSLSGEQSSRGGRWSIEPPSPSNREQPAPRAPPQAAPATRRASVDRIVLRDRVRDMHAHALQAYMDHGYPHDELLPLSCEGRRWDARKRGTLDDSLGGYMMTLVDGVDTQLVVGDHEAFARSLDIITSEVSFDRDVSVSTFEATIRVLGGLLSAHYLVTEPVLRPAILRAAANSTLDASPVDTRRRWARELKGWLPIWALDCCRIPHADGHTSS